MDVHTQSSRFYLHQSGDCNTAVCNSQSATGLQLKLNFESLTKSLGKTIDSGCRLGEMAVYDYKVYTEYTYFSLLFVN